MLNNAEKKIVSYIDTWEKYKVLLYIVLSSCLLISVLFFVKAYLVNTDYSYFTMIFAGGMIIYFATLITYLRYFFRLFSIIKKLQSDLSRKKKKK